MCSPKSNPERAFKVSFTSNKLLLRVIWTPTSLCLPGTLATCSSFTWVWWQTFDHQGRGFWKVIEVSADGILRGSGFSPTYVLCAYLGDCLLSPALLQLWGSFTTNSCSTG